MLGRKRLFGSKNSCCHNRLLYLLGSSNHFNKKQWHRERKLSWTSPVAIPYCNSQELILVRWGTGAGEKWKLMGMSVVGIYWYTARGLCVWDRRERIRTAASSENNKQWYGRGENQAASMSRVIWKERKMFRKKFFKENFRRCYVKFLLSFFKDEPSIRITRPLELECFSFNLIPFKD